MRLYLKLVAMIVLFVAASRFLVSEHRAEVVFVLRTAYVCSFGSRSDYQALIDQTQRRLARETGNLRLYDTGKLAELLFAERRAAAARSGIQLGDDELELLRIDCLHDALTHVGSRAPRSSSAYLDR